MADDLTGKHVVVVGGSSGMGLALARQAGEAGARVTIMGRDAGRLEKAAAQAPGASTRVLDIGDTAAISAAAKDLGAVDHLAITAGTFVRQPLADNAPADWRRVMEERIVGPMTLIQALAPQVTTSITLFTGTVARRPGPGFTLLAAACGAAEAVVRTLALELAPLRVNAVAPGAFDTPMLAEAMGARKDELVAASAARLPVRRIGAPEDAAQAALFVMTNPFMTGAIVEIDGGAHLV